MRRAPFRLPTLLLITLVVALAALAAQRHVRRWRWMPPKSVPVTGTVTLDGKPLDGAIIFFFLAKVLMSDQQFLDPADFEMVGVLGKLSVPIREGGTGELIYSQMGTRRVCGARSDDGSAIAKGSEVVVTRYEKGIAYVCRWSELSGELDEPSAAEKSE